MLFEAVFKPSPEADYNEEALKHADTRIALSEGWIAKDGPHKGQMCFYVPNSTVGLIPASDLKNLKPIPAVQWTDLHRKMGYGRA